MTHTSILEAECTARLCLPMVRQYFDIMIVASSNKDWL